MHIAAFVELACPRNFGDEPVIFYIYHLRYVDDPIQFFNNAFDSLQQNTTGTSLVVFNTGLHFNEETEFSDYIRVAVNDWVGIAKNRSDHFIFAYRETSAQHFNTPDGTHNAELLGGVKPKNLKFLHSYPSLAALRAGLLKNNNENDKIIAKHGPFLHENLDLELRCVPISPDRLYSNNWRNRIFLDFLTKADKSSQIQIIRFYNITRGRHDFHKGSFFPQDCTHYALVAPMLWLPVWDQMYKIFHNRMIALQRKP